MKKQPANPMEPWMKPVQKLPQKQTRTREFLPVESNGFSDSCRFFAETLKQNCCAAGVEKDDVLL